MRASRRLIVIFLLLFLGTSNYVHTAVYYAFNGESSASITSSDVYLEQGTAGTSVVYPNATSAASQVDSHATTFYPNDYNVTYGLYFSGSTPSSVNQVDSDYFTVNSSGSHTSNLVYHPVSFTPLNGTSTSFDWGINTTSFTQVSVHTNYRYMGGTSPDIPNMKVTSLHIRASGSGTVAIALYTGGALNNPTAAVKRTETYNVAVSAGWNEIDVPDYDWTSNTVTWIGWAHNTGIYYSTSSANAGDFQTVRGRWAQTNPADADETVAMPVNPGAGSFSDFWYAVYVEYEVGAISNLTADDGEFMRFKSYLSANTIIEDPVDNDSSDVDSSADKGFYTNFTLQQVGPDTQYDTLREEYFGSILLDYVDNNTTDIDSSQGKGTHSNFTAQKTGPDSTYDILTELNTTTNTHSFDATGGYMLVGNGSPDWGSTSGTISFWVKWDTVANRPWGQHADLESRISGSNLVLDWGSDTTLTSSTSFTAGNWYFIGITWNEATDILRLYVGDQSTAPTLDSEYLSWTVTASTIGVTQNNFMASRSGFGPLDGHGDDLRYWDTDRSLVEIQGDYDIELAGSETNLRSYFKLNNDFVDVGLDNNDGSGSGSYSFSTDIPYSGISYELDLEAQWTELTIDYQGSEIAVKTGSFNGSELLQIDLWSSSSQWQTLGTLASNSWNNFTIGPYLWSSDFTVRFKGASEAGDSTKDTWQIDASLIRLLGRIDSEDPVDDDTSDVDSSVDRGNLIDFSNMMSLSLGYSTLSETQSSVSLEGSAESQSGTYANSHSFQYNLQSGAGNDRLVVVCVTWEDVQATASASVTFDGVAMAEVATVTVGTGYSAYAGMWYMNESILPATTGNKWVNVAVSETITQQIYVTVAEYTGVAQEAPDDFDTDSNTFSGNTAVTLTVADDGSIIVAASVQGGTNSWANTNNLNNLQTAILTSSGGALGHHMDASSGDTTVGWNNLNTREGMVGAVWSAADYSTDYRLDQEVQWTDLPYDLPNEELCIYTDSMGAEDLNVEIWNTTASDWDLLFSDLTASSWNNISITGWLTSDTLTIRFVGSSETGDSVQDQWEIDVALIHVWNSGTAEYSLDMEYQWTGVDFTESSEELCFYGGSMGTENILVDVWYDDAWNNVFADLSPGWNNVSVTQYLDSGTFTIRVRDGTPTSDALLDTWEFDVSLLHVWGSTYTAEVEFEGTSNLYEWPQIEWTVDSAWTNASIRVDIQLYNYSGGTYPASGNGFSNYTSGPADTDETESQVITDSPMDFRNVTSGWKIKVRGEYTSQFELSVDYIALNTTYYDEYTAQTEFIFTDITDNQSPNLNFTVVSHNSIDGATVTLQVWNYTSFSFPSSGMGYLSYSSTGANNTRWLNITNNAQGCLSGSYARIRVTSVYSTTDYYQQLTNLVRLLQEESTLVNDYALRVTNNGADLYTVRLVRLSDSNIDRIINCTIYLSSGETQLQVIDGVFTLTTGTWANLPASSSLDILIETSTVHLQYPSVIDAELEVLRDSTSTYTKFPIQFTII